VFRFSSIPGARGRPLLGPSPVLIVVSISTPPLRFFQGKCYAYPFGKKKGAIFGMEGVAVNVSHPEIFNFRI
jgi:hypothetical protein